MQNSHSQWRIDFARQLAGNLVPIRGVHAIVVAGSVARGFADAYSDIEIPVFWDTLPSDRLRRSIAGTLAGEFIFGYDGPAREDQLLVRGVQIDLWHITVRRQEAVLRAVLVDHQTDLGSLNALDTLRSCIPLHGEELVRGWKQRAQAYPDQLAEKIVREGLASLNPGQLALSAQRNNPTAYHAQLCELQQGIFLVLLALNRLYFPTYKWMYQVLGSMRVKPESIEKRFRRAFDAPCQEGLADIRLIIEETLHLVEAQFPRMELAAVYRRLAYVRAGREGPLNI